MGKAGTSVPRVECPLAPFWSASLQPAQETTLRDRLGKDSFWHTDIGCDPSQEFAVRAMFVYDAV